jgi:hypothetical protein
MRLSMKRKEKDSLAFSVYSHSKEGTAVTREIMRADKRSTLVANDLRRMWLGMRPAIWGIVRCE